MSCTKKKTCKPTYVIYNTFKHAAYEYISLSKYKREICSKCLIHVIKTFKNDYIF